jgi:glycosyltransferase involved in cell wall biosynthesis
VKVTFCAHDYANNTGGPLAWLLRMLPELKNRGVEPKLLFMAEDLRQTPHVEMLAAAGIETVGTTFPQSTEHRVRWYLQQVIEDPPDVFVPSHIFPAYYAAGWMRAAGIATVGVLHSDDEFYRGVQSEFVFGSEFFRLSGLVCVSDYLQQQVLRNRPDGVLVERIPCGVPLVDGSASPPVDELQLVYVGRLVEEQKRIAEVAQALCRATREVPSVEAVLYGEGTGRRMVEEILAAEGVDTSRWLPGLVPNDQVQNLLLNKHVFVLLSDYEGLPIALMEAMACGLVPVCLETKSGILELVKHNLNGLIVANRGDDFVAAIRRLKQDKELWQRLSAAAKNTIKAEFSNPVAAGKWSDLLQRVNRDAPPRKELKMPVKMKLPHAHPGLDAMFSPDLSSRRAVLKFRAGRFLKHVLQGRPPFSQ